MSGRIRSAVVVGGGSAGFLAALTFRRMLPQINLTVVHSPDIPIIGVGESTTGRVPLHLHETLGIGRDEFHKQVRPTWKLGLRLEWGAANVPHFNYSFDRYLEKHVPGLDKRAAHYCLADPKDCSVFNAIMDRGRSPVTLEGRQFAIDPRAAYHLPNKRFIDYLQRQSLESGATLIEDEVEDVVRAESGGVERLRLKSGREVTGDLFIDCSGFRSLLLGETLDEPYLSYADTLFCDRAVVGSWRRSDQILPYTTASTMDHGWAWRIDFPDVVTRGYVFSSAFCSDEDAAQELQKKNPQLGDDLRVLAFPSGRYERHWVQNVVAVGNASGFVEPLEATALHLIIEQVYKLADSLIDSDAVATPDMRDLLNQAFQTGWDDVRDFLALHYKYNHHADTPFWRHCRAETSLGGAEALVQAYERLGPSLLLKRLIASEYFEYEGYISMLVGLRVPTDARRELSDEESRAWQTYQRGVRNSAVRTMPMREALERVHGAAPVARTRAERRRQARA
jgi:tryptophan halogenase